MLSDIQGRNLEVSRDLVLDSNWDVYRQDCGGGGIIGGRDGICFLVLLYRYDLKKYLVVGKENRSSKRR